MMRSRCSNPASTSPNDRINRSLLRKVTPLLIRLAVVLIILITFGSVLATIIPQHQPADFYSSRYSTAFADLILFFSINDFFHSAVFYGLIDAFFVDLTVCSVVRIVTRLSSRAPKRFGPDLIHLGLLLVIIAGVISSMAREEIAFSMNPGESRALPGGYRITLVSFDFKRYPDGRPKDWISHLLVAKDGASTQYEIEVNRPLTLGGVTLYQSSYQEFSSALLTNGSGQIELLKNEGIETADGTFAFLGPGAVTGSGLFARLTKNGEIMERLTVNPGGKIGTMTVRQVFDYYTTVLQAIRDPSSWLVILALTTAAAGLILTLVLRRKEAR
jgi:hypothetical protein